MARVIAGMTISLDGFVADESGGVDRLYPDLADLQDTPYMKGAIEETGAVLMGKRTFGMAEDPDWYVGNYEFQVPIFVVTRHVPRIAPKQDQHLTFTFVTDGVESAVTQATAAARTKAVQVVGGSSVIRQLLHARLVDELHIDVMPVLLVPASSLRRPRARAPSAGEDRCSGDRAEDHAEVPRQEVAARLCRGRRLSLVANTRSRQARASRRRRRRMARVEHDLSDAQWAALTEAWGGCAYCGKTDGAIQRDCVLALSAMVFGDGCGVVLSPRGRRGGEDIEDDAARRATT